MARAAVHLKICHVNVTLLFPQPQWVSLATINLDLRRRRFLQTHRLRQLNLEKLRMYMTVGSAIACDLEKVHEFSSDIKDKVFIDEHVKGDL